MAGSGSDHEAETGSLTARRQDRLEQKVTARYSRDPGEEEEPRIDTNGHELIPLFASICVHSWLG